MRMLTRYIARQYLLNIVSLFVILFGFVVTVDCILNFRRFRSAAEEAVQQNGGSAAGELHELLLTFLFIVDLWGPRLLQLFNYLSGAVLIAAMGFTCTQLVRHREFVAMLASGIGLHRAARPFLLVAMVVTTFQIINQEILVPAVAPLLTRSTGDSGRHDVAQFRVRLAEDSEGRLLYAGSFDDETNMLHVVQIWERDEQQRISRVIVADSATWDGSAWILEGGRTDPIPDPQTGDVASQPVTRLETSLDPTRLKVIFLSGYGQSLSWRQISEMIAASGADHKEAERLDRIRWGRIGGLVSNFVTLAIALPFFLLRLPQPMIVPALKCAPIVVAGLAAAAAGSSVSMPGMPVWLSAFVPSLVLVPIALALYSGIRT